MAKHSRFSASGCSRWLKCSGSVELEAPFPDYVNPAAKQGTIAHLLPDNHSFQFDYDELAKEYEQEMIDGLKIWQDHLFSVLNTSKDFRVLIEQRVVLGFIDSELYGTADCIIEDNTNKTLHVIDYKFGKTKVNPDCDQLKYYGVGACYKKLFEKVVLTIVQPRYKAKTIPKVRSFETTKEELTPFAKKLAETVKNIKEGKTVLEAGSHCFWCKAKEVCGAYREKYLTKAIDDFSPITKEV